MESMRRTAVSALAQRVEDKIVTQGGHRVWTGAVNTHGVPVMRADGKLRSVRRVVTEIRTGKHLDGALKLAACPVDSRCLTVEHLRSGGEPIPVPTQPRAKKGGGSVAEVRPGTYKLSVVAGRHRDGTPRRAYRTVHGTRADATKALAAFVTEVADGSSLPPKDARNITVDELVALYMQSCREDSDDNPKVWEHSTLYSYEGVRKHWITPSIGSVRAKRAGDDEVDRCFARMQRLSASHSQMNQTKSLLSGAFKWGRRRKLVSRNPLAGYELPRSRYISHEVVPPEVDEVIALLEGAAEHTPDIAPILSLAATTGMRRGELSGLRRSRVHLASSRVLVDSAVNDAGGTLVVKGTKTHQTRWVSLDPATAELLQDHLADMDRRAGDFGATLDADPFVFSLEPDCSKPMRPDYMTRQAQVLRRKLGLSDAPFATSILAIRKFTSTELMDAGFNPSLVSGRQGHTVQVMLKHYSKARSSADRKAASHLGNRVHGRRDSTETP